MNEGFKASSVKIPFSFKPFDLRPCIFPGNIGFGILNIPGGDDYYISLVDPHFLVLGSWNPPHPDYTVHTLQFHPF